MKAMDELVEDEQELMFRGEKATGISSFLHVSVVGSSRTSQFLRILRCVCVCVELFFSPSLPVFQPVMEVDHGVADL